jgi:hypothetical protein
MIVVKMNQADTHLGGVDIRPAIWLRLVDMSKTKREHKEVRSTLLLGRWWMLQEGCVTKCDESKDVLSMF